jgi:hypothetical protein
MIVKHTSTTMRTEAAYDTSTNSSLIRLRYFSRLFLRVVILTLTYITPHNLVSAQVQLPSLVPLYWSLPGMNKLPGIYKQTNKRTHTSVIENYSSSSNNKKYRTN